MHKDIISNIYISNDDGCFRYPCLFTDLWFLLLWVLELHFTPLLFGLFITLELASHFQHDNMIKYESLFKSVARNSGLRANLYESSAYFLREIREKTLSGM